MNYGRERNRGNEKRKERKREGEEKIREGRGKRSKGSLVKGNYLYTSFTHVRCA